MAQKNVLYNVQRQKIKQTQTYLIQWLDVKQSFLKKHIPIQQRLIKNLDSAAEITMLRLREAAVFLRQQRQVQTMIQQKLQRGLLSDNKRFTDNITQHSKIGNTNTKKQPSSSGNIQTQPPKVIWAGNIDKVFNCMANSHKKRLVDSKQYVKNIQKYQEELNKQQVRYLTQLRKCIKVTQKQLQNIDSYQKQQQQTLLNIRKQSKNKNRDGCFYLTQYKKLQNQFKGQFTALSQRGKQVFSLMKCVLDNQKLTSKKLRQIFEQHCKSKNAIYKDNQFDQRLLGALFGVEDSVVDTRRQYFNKYLLSEDQIQLIKTLVPQPDQNGPVPQLQCIVRYLRLTQQQYFAKINLKSKIQLFANNLAYKRWPKASLAQGWLITTYVSVTIYLTYDNLLVIFNNQNTQLLRRVNLKQAKINKLGEGNVIFLQQTVKGFFSDGKEEYQIRFEDQMVLEEFMVFIQHKMQ